MLPASLPSGGGGQGSSVHGDGMQPGGGGQGSSAHGDGSKRSSSPSGGYHSGQGPSAPRCPKCLKMEKRLLKLERPIKKLKLRQFCLGKKVWVHGSKLYDLKMEPVDKPEAKKVLVVIDD
ncbi:hypothetical protein BDA96_01G233700 [Sorghum bicolor]|uniref:Uncharacterized protein n=2 Tax=Sorghum bicolor TaxID=4558 RepID=A0A921S0E0_SORBI|nr:uncharacterized protein LOC110432407 [Sorghum bicolor]KAG0549186.1 hypothetical protein BDA96_01G233700 [Sorghum bicolor]KXG35215.1 hypothetical protein SORBI_3002G146400 [Sorghum bicolor]|eukprot:XP_021308448.1 uncharacterized protein LOC110432407 [Sorghum bicolor]